MLFICYIFEFSCFSVLQCCRSDKVVDIKGNGCCIDYGDDDECDSNESNIYCEIEELYEPVSHNQQQLVCKKSLVSSGSALENEKLLQNRNVGYFLRLCGFCFYIDFDSGDCLGSGVNSITSNSSYFVLTLMNDALKPFQQCLELEKFLLVKSIDV